MCIILDANMLGGFLANPPRTDAKPIHNWLERGDGNVIYSTGGKFANEIVGKARDSLAGYARAGMATLVSSERFQADENYLKTRIRSDDPHVIALAREIDARLLYTGDSNLMKDFKNKEFINHPRGRVYSRADNANLLTKSTCKRR